MLALLAQTAAAWYGAGFIWTMQVLNYPLLDRVGEQAFRDYEAAHNARFARVVAPGVAVAAVSALVLLFSRPEKVPGALAALSALLVLAILAATALWQAPAHARLSGGFDAGVHARLVRTNWVRTAAWTLLGLLDLLMLQRVVG
jgi:hypothetical protein